MKAILVTKMPERCLECELVWDEMNNGIVRCSNGRRLDENEDYIYKQKPGWCPLKPLPRKNQGRFFHSDFGENTYVCGWNACLREITGEADD